MDGIEEERLLSLCEALRETIDDGAARDFTQAAEFLSRQSLEDVARMALIALRDARFLELAALRAWHTSRRGAADMGIRAMAPFDRGLDTILFERAQSVDQLIDMVSWLEDPEGYICDHQDETVEAVEDLLEKLSPEAAVNALIGVAFEADQSGHEDRLIGAWHIYFDQCDGDALFKQAMDLAPTRLAA